ncbi:hypothetical protein C8Q74DRAFT_272085 [Fomes fomentarius]|nr:hypothetical protein C8Q74DRAFT_272085 [Fomes fomentarius]
MATTLAAWQDEPNFRGTFSILSSCLSTLFLCVWTALHADIPQVDAKLRRFVDKTGWVFIGLVAPELLLWVAFQQRRAAHALTSYAKQRLSSPPVPPTWLAKKIREVRRLMCMRQQTGQETQSDDSVHQTSTIESGNIRGGSQHRHPWTMRHSYYAIMGGFVLQDPHFQQRDNRYLPDWQGNGVLTLAGVRYLMEHKPDLIPDVPLAHINDRSKADVLGKIFVTVQVLWFCLDSVNRFAQQLTLSLLEVATIAHALCTFFTYLIWWEKPLDISQPTAITSELASQVGALMSMASGERRYAFAGHVVFERKHKALVQEKLSDNSEKLSDNSEKLPDNSEKLPDNSHALIKVMVAPWMRVGWGTPRKHDSTPWWVRCIFNLAKPCSLPTNSEAGENAATELRENLAAEAHKTHGLPYPPSSRPLVAPVAHLQEATFALNEESSDASSKASGIRRALDMVLIAVLTLIYGFVHMLGWTAEFPTALEHSLWRYSTLVVMGSGLVLHIVVYFVGRVRIHLQLERKTDLNLGYRLAAKVAKAVIAGIPIIYLVASAYLVGESFRQLLALPRQAYILPSWGNYWPHFS